LRELRWRRPRIDECLPGGGPASAFEGSLQPSPQTEPRNSYGNLPPEPR
jgi:hypothetical protein